MTTETTVQVAVCGAHMTGLPLNEQLLRLGARLLSKTMTSPNYRLYHLAAFQPPRPGMIRVRSGGQQISLEVWELPLSQYGAFVTSIPAPLGIGRLELADGSWVQGFLCEHYALDGAEDISRHGGWRQFLAAVSGS